LGLRWGKGADLAPKKVEKGIFEKRFDQGAPRDCTWRPTLGPSWRQEGVKRAKLGPRWRQVGAKSGQRERRGGLRSDLEPKSRILKLVVFRWEYVYFADIGRLSGGKLGIKIGKMRSTLQKMKQRWSREGKKQQRYKKKREDTAKAKQD
jgi:hypothetical protein